jgi:hypothetical protein
MAHVGSGECTNVRGEQQASFEPKARFYNSTSIMAESRCCEEFIKLARRYFSLNYIIFVYTQPQRLSASFSFETRFFLSLSLLEYYQLHEIFQLCNLKTLNQIANTMPFVVTLNSFFSGCLVATASVSNCRCV